MLRGKDIVCISSLDWDAMWTSKQQIMHRLSQTNRVLYVEEPVTMLAPFKVPARWRRWRAVAPQLDRVDAGLWKLTPPPVLPFGNMRPRLNDANQAMLANYIRWAMGHIWFDEEYIFWTYLPTVAAAPRPSRCGGARRGRHGARRRPADPHDPRFLAPRGSRGPGGAPPGKGHRRQAG